MMLITGLSLVIIVITGSVQPSAAFQTLPRSLTAFLSSLTRAQRPNKHSSMCEHCKYSRNCPVDLTDFEDIVRKLHRQGESIKSMMDILILTSAFETQVSNYFFNICCKIQWKYNSCDNLVLIMLVCVVFWCFWYFINLQAFF